MLCKKFELVPIKIGFYMNFLSCSTIGPKSQSLVKLHVLCQKWLEKNSPYTCIFQYMYMYAHPILYKKLAYSSQNWIF